MIPGQIRETLMGFFGKKKDAATLVSEGLALIEAGKLKKAAATFESVTELDPSHAQAWFCLGTILGGNGDLEAAIACYRKSADHAPPELQATPLFNLGNALQALGRTDEALDAFTRATTVNPEFADAWINRGRLLDDSGHHEEAIACYDRALALAPEDVTALANRGNSLRGLKRFADAKTSYEAALVLDPGDLASQLGLGVCLAHLGQPEEGLRLVDRAIAEVRFPPALVERATVLAQLECNDEALASIDEALELGLCAPEPYNNRGEILAKLGRVDESVQSFDEALKLDAQYAPALFGKARVLCNAGRFPAAKETIDRYFACSDGSDDLSEGAQAIVALCRNAGVE